MAADRFLELSRAAGLACIGQEIINGSSPLPIDCISVVTQPSSKRNGNGRMPALRTGTSAAADHPQQRRRSSCQFRTRNGWGFGWAAVVCACLARHSFGTGAASRVTVLATYCQAEAVPTLNPGRQVGECLGFSQDEKGSP